MLEIDVDVGRLVALAADEALEQEIEPRRIDRGDAEAIADRRIRRRAAALAQDAELPRLAHDVVDGEEIRRIAKLRDELQFARNLAAHRLRHAGGIALGGAFPAQPLEPGLRRRAVGRGLVGVFVAQLVEIEAAAFGDLDAGAYGLRMGAKQPRHLLGRLQVALGIGGEAKARLGDGAAFADAGHDVLQASPLRRVVEHVVGSNQPQAPARGQIGQAMEALGVVAAIKVLRRKISGAGEIRFQPIEKMREGRIELVRRQGHHHLARAEFDEVVIAQPAFGLGGAALAAREQAAQPAISGAVGREA